jgi:sec-independent protein translocase protein TatA
MGIDNPVHILFIAIVALIVLGPKRLPEVARALGHGLREFREAVSLQGDQTITQQPAAPPQVMAETAAQASTAMAAPQAVDPAEPVRSGDAPDRGSL